MTADVIGPVCTEASYEERVRAFFALSGARLDQLSDPPRRGDGIWYHLPDDEDGVWHGDPNHSEAVRGFATVLGAMKAALYAMGVDIASDRFTHETRPLNAR